jgi:hypothetical protein
MAEAAARWLMFVANQRVDRTALAAALNFPMPQVTDGVQQLGLSVPDMLKKGPDRKAFVTACRAVLPLIPQ